MAPAEALVGPAELRDRSAWERLNGSPESESLGKLGRSRPASGAFVLALRIAPGGPLGMDARKERKDRMPP